MFWQQAQRLKVTPGGVACLPLRMSRRKGACMDAAFYGAATGHVQPNIGRSRNQTRTCRSSSNACEGQGAG